MRKNVGCLFLVLLVLTAVIACKSQPAPTPEPSPPVEETLDPEAGPPSAEVMNSLNEAEARAAEARKLAMDFEAPDYCPDEWNSADSLYSQAGSSKNTVTQKDARESAARYNAAADALQAAADLAIPQYADTVGNEILAARQKAINVGADYWAQDYLLQADNTGLEAVSLYEAKDYYAARDKGLLARDMYGAIETGVEAYLVRLELENRDFYRYDPAAIDAADQMGFAALDDYEAGNIAAATLKAKDVNALYRQSMEKCRESYATDTGTNASRERQRALDLKANVASRNDYNAANIIYNQAISSFRAKKFDEAANLYDESRTMFVNAAETAITKRRAAEEARQRADLKLMESDEAAQRAEMILEGGAR